MVLITSLGGCVRRLHGSAKRTESRMRRRTDLYGTSIPERGVHHTNVNELRIEK